MNAVVSTDTLKDISGLKRAADISRWLGDQNIRYFTSKKGPWTTVNLIDAAKGLLNGQDLGTNNEDDLL